MITIHILHICHTAGEVTDDENLKEELQAAELILHCSQVKSVEQRGQPCEDRWEFSISVYLQGYCTILSHDTGT